MFLSSFLKQSSEGAFLMETTCSHFIWGLPLLSVLFQKSAPCGSLHLCQSESDCLCECLCCLCLCLRLLVFVSPLIKLYVSGCCGRHGYGSSVITAVSRIFRPSRVLPRPGCHENAVNGTKAAGERTLVSMLQIQHTYCRRNTHTPFWFCAYTFLLECSSVVYRTTWKKRPFK